jgi:hypothetical protein
VSPRRLVALLIAALTLLMIGASWSSAHAQRDTTVCTAFRTRTAATGAVVSTSVAKVGCSGVARVDTVKLAGLRDTVYFDPQINATRDSISYSGPFAWRVGVRPAAFKLPAAPGAGRVDTVKVPSPPVHDTVYVAVPPSPVHPPSDTTGLFVYDIPSRTGENNVFKGTAYLGRVMVDSVGQWFAYRYTDGQSLMPMSGPYPSREAAMTALATVP